MKVKFEFSEDVTVDDARKGTPAEESYARNRTYSLEEGSAQHWFNRGKGDFVTKKAPAVKASPEPEPEPDADPGASGTDDQAAGA